MLQEYKICFSYRQYKAIGIPSETCGKIMAECALDAYDLCLEDLENSPIDFIVITAIINITLKKVLFSAPDSASARAFNIAIRPYPFISPEFEAHKEKAFQQLEKIRLSK